MTRVLTQLSDDCSNVEHAPLTFLAFLNSGSLHNTQLHFCLMYQQRLDCLLPARNHSSGERYLQNNCACFTLHLCTWAQKPEC